MTTQQPGFSMSQYASSKDMFAAMIARITELESQLAQRFDAADMATASAQGFRDGAASVSAGSEPVARAIWALMREHEDRCDAELEDLKPSHPIWAYADAARAALAAGQAGAPANMQVTERMRAAGDCAWMTADRVDSARVFRAMLAAAPQPSTAAQGDALSDSVRTPLDSLHADAAYLIGRLRDGSMPYVRVIEIIRERIDAAKAAIRARAAHGQAPAEAEGISREDWIEQAVRVYLIAGDTDEQAQECAAYLWGELDMDDLADPYDAAMSDIEGRNMPRKETQ